MAVTGSVTAPAAKEAVNIEYPPLFEATEGASKTGRRTYAGLIQTDVVLLIVAATAGSLSTVGPTIWQQVVALVAAVAIGTAILLRLVNRSQRPQDEWFGGRAIAELVKSDSWRYMMHVAPFDSGDDKVAKEEFLNDLTRIRTSVSDRHLTLGPSSAGSQVPQSMETVRGLLLPNRQDLYRDKRMDDQINWYKEKAASLSWLGRILVSVGVGAEMVALAWLLARFAFSWNLNLIAVFTSIAVGATALSQLYSHVELVRRYRLAQQNLGEIRTRLPASGETEFAAVVIDAEAAISSETGAWLAKRS